MAAGAGTTVLGFEDGGRAPTTTGENAGRSVKEEGVGDARQAGLTTTISLPSSVGQSAIGQVTGRRFGVGRFFLSEPRSRSRSFAWLSSRVDRGSVVVQSQESRPLSSSGMPSSSGVDTSTP